MLILRLVLDFLKPIIDKRLGKEDGEKDLGELCAQIIERLERATVSMASAAKQISELHQWHNVRNSDGGFVWYVPGSLEKAIETLAKNVAIQSSLLQEMCTTTRDTNRMVEHITKR